MDNEKIQPLSRAFIERVLDGLQIMHTKDNDGDIYTSYETNITKEKTIVAWFLIEGDEDEKDILKIMARIKSDIPKSQWPTMYLLTSEFHKQNRFGQAVLRPNEKTDTGIIFYESNIVLAGGATDWFLQNHIIHNLFTAETLLQMIEERPPQLIEGSATTPCLPITLDLVERVLEKYGLQLRRGEYHNPSGTVLPYVQTSITSKIDTGGPVQIRFALVSNNANVLRIVSTPSTTIPQNKWPDILLAINNFHKEVLRGRAYLHITEDNASAVLTHIITREFPTGVTEEQFLRFIPDALGEALGFFNLIHVDYKLY